MGWGAIAAAVGSAASGGLMDIWATNKNNKAAKHAAEAQRGWEGYMSNTAHQREVDDLRAAGLNPILSATGGSGASTPAGATAQVHRYDTSKLDFLSAAKQLQKIDEEIEGIQAGIETQGTVRELNRAQAIKNIADAKEAEARSATAQAQEEQIRAQTRLIEAETPRSAAMGRVYDTPYLGTTIAATRELTGVANSALDVAIKGKGIFSQPIDPEQVESGRVFYYDKNGNVIGGRVIEKNKKKVRTIQSFGKSKKRR